MNASKGNTKPIWIDPDEIPDMSTPYWVEKFKSALVSRGRPALPETKVSTTIRLDKDVLEGFRKGGPGWQTRINEALRQHLKQG